MRPVHWFVVAFFLLGFAHPAFFVVSALVWEFGIRRGSTTTAVWVESHLHGRGRGGFGGGN